MNKFLSYPWAIVFGLYFYALFQAIFLIRFGSINTSFGVLEVLLIAIGILSVLWYMYFARKLPAKRGLLFVAFLVAVFFSYVGALGGALFGPIGLLIYGLVPFAVIVPIGYWLIKRFTNKPRVAESAPIQESADTAEGEM